MNKRRTRFWIVAVALALIAGVVGARQAREAQQEEAITSVLKSQQAQWNQGDVGAFMNGYWNSSDLTFAGTSGFTRGWEPVRQRYEKTYAGKAAMGTLAFSELEVRPLGSDAALVLGKWHLERQAGDIGGIFTLVFRRFPEGWRIIHDHTTQSPPETK